MEGGKTGILSGGERRRYSVATVALYYGWEGSLAAKAGGDSNLPSGTTGQMAEADRAAMHLFGGFPPLFPHASHLRSYSSRLKAPWRLWSRKLETVTTTDNDVAKIPRPPFPNKLASQCHILAWTHRKLKTNISTVFRSQAKWKLLFQTSLP